MASPPVNLPRSGALSGRLLGFLNEQFEGRDDLSKVPCLAAQLDRECGDLELDVRRLTERLSFAASAWLSRSGEVRKSLSRIGSAGHGLRRPSRGGIGGMGSLRAGRILEMELPLLAKEVGRIEIIHQYAETTLKLEGLVGELEDAIFAIMSRSTRRVASLSHAETQIDTRWKVEKLLLAVKAMTDIEDVLLTVAHNRPQWTHLLMAVDSRVEKNLAILRPQALRDHRALLASLGWPPSLLTSNLEKNRSLEIPNPLVLMEADKREKYALSFLALCALQHLQAQRGARLHSFSSHQKGCKIPGGMDLGKQTCVSYDLWVIDELVHPIASRAEYHFSRWSDQPKFIFALVYKITRDFMDGVDNVLQPLIDQARLVGFSAREAWVSAMVKMLSEYLERRVFPVLARIYNNRNEEVNSSWLHLVDLMIPFDKRMQGLATSGNPILVQFADFEEIRRSLSVLSIFNEHIYWIKIWAEIELKVAEDKLKSELDDERSWFVDTRQQGEFHPKEDTESFLLCTREDYKAPPIAGSVVKITWAMIERGRALPRKQMRIHFIRSSARIILKQFFSILLQRCQDTEFMTSTMEDDALLKVAVSVNAARYCESVMREWNEDVSFLEMCVDEDDERKDHHQHRHSSFFSDEIGLLVKLETDCLEEIISALLLHFEALCWDYVQNIEQWEREQVELKDLILGEDLSVSPGFVEALDMLKDRVGILKLYLNSQDFMDLWRSIADGLDHFLFRSIPSSNTKFSCQGVNQIKADMRALFFVFKPFCARPEAFFPCTSDSLKLLTMPYKDVDFLLKILSKSESRNEECLRRRGLFHVTLSQAEKVLKNRVFGG